MSVYRTSPATAEERASVVAYLRDRAREYSLAQAGSVMAHWSAAYDAAASAIEHGAHRGDE